VSVPAAGLWGAGAGVGLLLIAAGVAGRPILARPTSDDRRWTSPQPWRVLAAVIAALAAAVATGWLVAGLLAGGGVVAAPRVLGGAAARDRAIARTEAVATWTEMIRDAIGAAAGLEEAVVATASIAPAPIRPEVRLLASRLQHHSLPDALARFADDVRHPSADLVVAALTIAARMEASDLGSLLSRLAESIRGEARMRIRVDVGRARVRTAAKVIVGVVVATIVLLALLNRDYLGAYDSGAGQLVLAVVGGIFTCGGWLLTRMAEIEVPERFTARRPEPA
jgi:tight adherence protein B